MSFTTRCQQFSHLDISIFSCFFCSGDVINLELVTFKRQFYESVSYDLDPDQTAAMVDLDEVSRYTKVLRLYYATGAPSRDPIGSPKFFFMCKTFLTLRPDFTSP